MIEVDKQLVIDIKQLLDSVATMGEFNNYHWRETMPILKELEAILEENK